MMILLIAMTCEDTLSDRKLSIWIDPVSMDPHHHHWSGPLFWVPRRPIVTVRCQLWYMCPARAGGPWPPLVGSSRAGAPPGWHRRPPARAPAPLRQPVQAAGFAAAGGLWPDLAGGLGTAGPRSERRTALRSTRAPPHSRRQTGSGRGITAPRSDRYKHCAGTRAKWPAGRSTAVPVNACLTAVEYHTLVVVWCSRSTCRGWLLGRDDHNENRLKVYRWSLVACKVQYPLDRRSSDFLSTISYSWCDVYLLII